MSDPFLLHIYLPVFFCLNIYEILLDIIFSFYSDVNVGVDEDPLEGGRRLLLGQIAGSFGGGLAGDNEGAFGVEDNRIVSAICGVPKG